ncbi:MAG TPA: chloride channel protein [Rhodocyclaceae bacterium]
MSRYLLRKPRLPLLAGRFSRLRWRTRLTLWSAACLAGLAVAGFAELSDIVQAWFFSLYGGHRWLPLLLTPAAGMAAVWATTRYFPNTQGSGIPQVIAATKLAEQNLPVAGLVSLRIAVGKIVLGALALFGGFSAGREGPSVQVAASIVHSARRLLPKRRALRESDLILAGGAAGIAAAFNTPLAGIVFAIEELSRRLESRTSGVLITSVIIAGLTAVGLQGDYTYFGALHVGTVSWQIVWPVIVCGLVGGVLGGIFSFLLILPQKCAHWPLWRWRAAHPVRFAGLCGVAVALIGFASGGASFGSGYGVTSSAIAGTTVLSWDEPFAKFLATVASYYSGIPGGIFAPCLAVGAGLGFDVARLLDVAGSAHPIVALCMAAFLAAVTQSPITSAVIVMEMINNHGMVVSLMAGALIARAVSSRFGPELYHRLAAGFLDRELKRLPAGNPALSEATT